MKNNDLIQITSANGMNIGIPKWMLLQSFNQLSNEDKAELAMNLVDMLGDCQRCRDLALDVLRHRCGYCGKQISLEEECYCMKDE